MLKYLKTPKIDEEIGDFCYGRLLFYFLNKYRYILNMLSLCKTTLTVFNPSLGFSLHLLKKLIVVSFGIDLSLIFELIETGFVRTL